ncbi:MAG: tRNA (N(6)-L-threonylcarbamoyladenosine(37)-C(2))-methylthiotransferase MtaB [Oscillospiraceae bacterium]|nr:tRNA (N(6)-L-threonylcarbamoyladenosine(37)-C(2))-methylthiotransferase MtaB [Oscillospiraceae bacterium]
MKYIIATLGCKVNQFETQALETMLNSRGFVAAESEEKAELVIVNTCAVTAESGRKSRQTIRKLKGENPGAIVAVCGCFSQLSPEEVSELGVDVVHGSGEKERFADDIEKALQEKQKIAWADDPFLRRSMEELPSGAVDGRTRAMLKIQDGCTNFCTYCIIPYTRGRVRSLPPERCAAQTEELAARGFRELVITGIEIASYGRDLDQKCELIDAVEACAGKAGDMRLRLGSLEPTVITEDFVKRLKATNKICDHFHLSLQSGCDNTLRRMNRKYDTAKFFETTQLLRKYFPDCGLTADLIVGFPGETEEDHAQTLDFIRKCGFSAMHIFPYSKRPGTKAAEMEEQVPNALKARRAAQAQKVANELEEAYLQSCIGKQMEVLFEAEKDGVSSGHASNYTHVYVHNGNQRGIVKNVKINGISNKMLVGICI